MIYYRCTKEVHNTYFREDSKWLLVLLSQRWKILALFAVFIAIRMIICLLMVLHCCITIRMPKKVDRLLNLGDISALYERVRPLNGETQNFYNPIENVTIAYIDRGDECPTKKHHNQKALVDYFNGSWCDFLYLFKNGVWYYRQRGDKRFKKLTVKNTSED